MTDRIIGSKSLLPSSSVLSASLPRCHGEGSMLPLLDCGLDLVTCFDQQKVSTQDASRGRRHACANGLCSHAPVFHQENTMPGVVAGSKKTDTWSTLGPKLHFRTNSAKPRLNHPKPSWPTPIWKRKTDLLLSATETYAVLLLPTDLPPNATKHSGKKCLMDQIPECKNNYRKATASLMRLLIKGTQSTTTLVSENSLADRNYFPPSH